jgi:hypothetical protein
VTKPQQPEIARSGRSEVDPAAVKTRHGGPTDATPPTGPVPEDNLPGHHPDQEQDKPAGPPPRPRARRATGTATAATATATKTAERVEGQATATITDLTTPAAEKPSRTATASFRFHFEPRVGPFAYALGITPWTTGVEVAGDELRVRFGAFNIKTPLDNIAGAEITGPYRFLKVAGPPHLSMADRGLTLATSTKQGVCLRFRKPVGLLRHPGLTVTVEDPDRLVELLTA